jgi:hypothetical protein
MERIILIVIATIIKVTQAKKFNSERMDN